MVQRRRRFREKNSPLYCNVKLEVLPSLTPTVFSLASVYSTLCNLQTHMHTHTHMQTHRITHTDTHTHTHKIYTRKQDEREHDQIYTGEIHDCFVCLLTSMYHCLSIFITLFSPTEGHTHTLTRKLWFRVHTEMLSPRLGMNTSAMHPLLTGARATVCGWVCFDVHVYDCVCVYL